MLSKECWLQAAVDQMRKVLNTISMDGVVVIGEGEKDEVGIPVLAMIRSSIHNCWHFAEVRQTRSSGHNSAATCH